MSQPPLSLPVAEGQLSGFYEIPIEGLGLTHRLGDSGLDWGREGEGGLSGGDLIRDGTTAYKRAAH